MFSLHKQALHFQGGESLKKVGQPRVFSVPEKALSCPIKDFDGRQKGHHYLGYLALLLENRTELE